MKIFFTVLEKSKNGTETQNTNVTSHRLEIQLKT